MTHYIRQALASWLSTPWSNDTMEEKFRSSHNKTILKLVIKNSHIEMTSGAVVQPGRKEPIQRYFEELASRNPDLTLTLYICTADHPELVLADDCPFFTFAKTINSRFIVIPDQFFTRDFSRYHRSFPDRSLDADVDAASARTPWASRIPRAMFRSKDFKYSEICKAALTLSDRVDARICGRPEDCIPELLKLRFEGLDDHYPTDLICGPRLDIAGQVQYKYLLHTFACWDSTYWKLRSNSLLFNLTKVYARSKDSDPLSTHQWYSYFMEPFHHYIPCTMDDLGEKIEWALGHDDEARQIADEGTHLARTEFTWEKSIHHVAGLLREFARLSPH